MVDHTGGRCEGLDGRRGGTGLSLLPPPPLCVEGEGRDGVDRAVDVGATAVVAELEESGVELGGACGEEDVDALAPFAGCGGVGGDGFVGGVGGGGDGLEGRVVVVVLEWHRVVAVVVAAIEVAVAVVVR